MSSLKAPILVIGATRSGTSVLVRTLGEAEGLVCWYEPNSLWKVGSAYNGSHYAGAEHAKPWVKRWIRKEFVKYQEQHGGKRIVEKSPTNVVRIPFVREIFPESKIVHIVRDGRANIRSQMEMTRSFASYAVAGASARNHLWRRLAITPWWEWPAYAPGLAEGLARRYVRRKDGVSWFGLKYPGYKKDMRTLSPNQIAAKQWVVAVESSQAALASVPSEMYHELRYEDLARDPRTEMAKVLSFCGAEVSEAYLETVAETIHDRSGDKWLQELDPAAVEEAMPIMGPLLKRLGYI